jgi:integrase
VASTWIIRRKRNGKERKQRSGTSYRVLYRTGGRESKARYLASFPNEREAKDCAAWARTELLSRRGSVVDLGELWRMQDEATAITFARKADEWRRDRSDVADATSTVHRVALARATRSKFGSIPYDRITTEDGSQLVAELVEKGYKRETIRKTIKYAAAVLEDAGIFPNPLRSKKIRLPYEELEEINPPTSGHVEAVFRLLAKPYRLPLLWLDWSGARVTSIDNITIGDYDERDRRIRLRASTTKTRAALWVELPDVLADAIEATLPPREDRDLEAPLFPRTSDGLLSDALRTAINRACKAAGVPHFHPHDLRHRRISLLHRQGRSWAEIARFVGQRKLSITADTYTHVLIDAAELDYAALLRVDPVRTPVRTS